jgi:hypothetical protein
MLLGDDRRPREAAAEEVARHVEESAPPVVNVLKRPHGRNLQRKKRPRIRRGEGDLWNPGAFVPPLAMFATQLLSCQGVGSLAPASSARARSCQSMKIFDSGKR